MKTITYEIKHESGEESFLQRFMSLVSKRQYHIVYLSYNGHDNFLHVELEQRGSLTPESLAPQIKNMYGCVDLINFNCQE